MNYKHVGESDTQLLGSRRNGDRIARMIIIPLTNTSVGTVSIKDGTSDPIIIYSDTTSGRPMSIELNIQSQAGWSVITGANISVIIVGEW